MTLRPDATLAAMRLAITATFTSNNRQKRVATAVMSLLTHADEIASRTVDGHPIRALATELIKPNDRLTSLERLAIYNRQYWFLSSALPPVFDGLSLGIAYVAEPRSEAR